MTLEASIIVTAHSIFVKEHSLVLDQHYLWNYEITIVNNSDQIVQLLSRYWKITDGEDKIKEVRGQGVVGLQPIIKPGKTFIYNSFCQLITTYGSMQGYYEMQTLDEVRFKINIPSFTLIATSEILH